MPRSDRRSAWSAWDSVANTARDIAVIIMAPHHALPEAIQESVLEYVEACTATCSQALLAIQELDELLEVGFSGREVKQVEAMLKLLDKMERRTKQNGHRPTR